MQKSEDFKIEGKWGIIGKKLYDGILIIRENNLHLVCEGIIGEELNTDIEYPKGVYYDILIGEDNEGNNYTLRKVKFLTIFGEFPKLNGEYIVLEGFKGLLQNNKIKQITFKFLGLKEWFPISNFNGLDHQFGDNKIKINICENGDPEFQLSFVPNDDMWEIRKKIDMVGSFFSYILFNHFKLTSVKYIYDDDSEIEELRSSNQNKVSSFITRYSRSNFIDFFKEWLNKYNSNFGSLAAIL